MTDTTYILLCAEVGWFLVAGRAWSRPPGLWAGGALLLTALVFSWLALAAWEGRQDMVGQAVTLFVVACAHGMRVVLMTIDNLVKGDQNGRQ